MLERVYMEGRGTSAFETPCDRERVDYTQTARERGANSLEDVRTNYPQDESGFVSSIDCESTSGQCAVEEWGWPGVTVAEADGSRTIADMDERSAGCV